MYREASTKIFGNSTVRGTLALLAAALLGAAAARAQSPPPLTLEQAVGTALAKNPSLQAAGEYALAVDQGIAVARSGRLPRVDQAAAGGGGLRPRPCGCFR